MSEARLTSYTIICGAIAALAPFQFGYRISELNSPKDAIMGCDDVGTGLPNCLPMSESTFGLATSIFAIGGLVGAIIGGFLSNRLGRKLSLMLNTFVFLAGGMLGAFAVSPAMLIIGRFISGIGSGAGVTIAPVYIIEISPLASRGFMGLFTQMNIVIGIFVAQLFGLIFGTGTSWRLILGIGGSLAIIQLVLLFVITESPRHLFNSGKEEEARANLRKLRGSDDVEDEIEMWRAENKGQNEVSYDQEAGEGQAQKINIFNIFGMSKYRLPIVMVICLQIAQQFSGINAVFFYSTSIFASMSTEGSGNTEQLLTLLVGVTNVLTTIITVFVVDKIQRKKLLLLSMMTMCASLGLLAIANANGLNILGSTAVFLAVICFAPGLGPLPIMIGVELFESQAISAGNSINLVMNWVGTFVIGITFLPLQEAIGNFVFLIFMGFLLVLGAFFVVFLPETKDKTIEQVTSEFKF